MASHAPTEDAGPAAPLAGLVAIEIGHSVAAPYCGQVLGDLGARVIKVESPGAGDDARTWGPPFWQGASATFQGLNRNKESVTLDLKSEEGREQLRSLAAKADIIVQNMKPGLVDRLGLGASALTAANPRLIYCNLHAFGPVGPLKDSPGYDPLIQAFSGIMSVTGEAGRPPVRVGPSLIDMGTGLWCVVGILCALLRRKETGKGMVVDASLYETALALMTVPISNGLAAGKDPGRSGSETPMLAPYKAYEAADKHVVIAAGNDNLFRRLADALGHPEWGTDERFSTNPDRVANRVALNALIDEAVHRFTAAELVQKLTAIGVPCAANQSVSEVVAHPQTKALDMISASPDGRLQLVRTPLLFDGQRPAIRTNPPAVGEHNDILRQDP